MDKIQEFKEELQAVLLGEYGVRAPKLLVDFGETEYKTELEHINEYNEFTYEMVEDTACKLVKFHREYGI